MKARAQDHVRDVILSFVVERIIRRQERCQTPHTGGVFAYLARGLGVVRPSECVLCRLEHSLDSEKVLCPDYS